MLCKGPSHYRRYFMRSLGMRVFNIPYRLFIFSLTTASILGACIWIALYNLPILKALEERGEAAVAEVTWAGEPYWVFQRGNYSRIAWRQDMRYAYVTRAGDRIEDAKTMTKHAARNLRVGRTFDLVYLPDRPHIHNSSYGNGYADVGMIYALLALGAVCAFMIFYCWRQRPADWEGPKLWPPLSHLHLKY